MTRRFLFLIIFVSLFSLYALAGSPEYFRIARVSYVEGKVSFQHSNDMDWSAVTVNMPLEPGDRIYTGDGGRAEIEFDDGSIIRLASGTDVELLAMREEHVQMRVSLGLCFLNDRSSVDFEINTPAAAFTTEDKGIYRFEVAENGDTTGIVRRGEMEAANSRFTRRIESGEMLQISAAENATESVSRYAERDSWDEWNDRRNADLVSYNSRRYLPDYVYAGVSDLDRYGRWVTVDGYGYGWVPQVGFGWSPYWDGRWCYRPYFGWTWVSYEPWGWLPYHYGRWYHHGSFGWCWLPGPTFGFHFWSPGLVRFYHGYDRIAWCPLGPGDYYNVNNYYYHPTYNYYLTNLRLTQRRGPADLLNRDTPGAMRSVRPQQFLEGGFAGNIAEARRGSDIGSGDRMITGNLDLQPTARSYAPAPDRAAARPASDGASRAVVVRTAPETRSADGRYQQITNPAAAVPRARADVAGRDTGAGNARPAAGSAPDRAVQGRTYQVPSVQAGADNPATNNRNVPRGSDARDAVPRGQQPSAVSRNVPDVSARRLESQPQRSVNPDTPRVPRNETAAPTSRPQAERSAAPQRQEVARPQTPPANNKQPDSRVIKKNDQEPARSSYSAPQPQRYQQPQASVRSGAVTGGSARYAEPRSVGAAGSSVSSTARPSGAWSGGGNVRSNPAAGTGGGAGYPAARSLGSNANGSSGYAAARPSAGWSGAGSVRSAPGSGTGGGSGYPVSRSMGSSVSRSMGGGSGYSGSRSVGSSVSRSMGGGSSFGSPATRSTPAGGGSARPSGAATRRR